MIHTHDVNIHRIEKATPDDESGFSYGLCVINQRGKPLQFQLLLLLYTQDVHRLC